MKEEKIVLFDDPNLVQYRKDIEGWTGPDGLYYGKGPEGEQRARYANSTHKKCECGGIMSRGWTKCESCRAESSIKRFQSLEAIEWDGVSMMCIWNDDRFFSDMDEVYEYCEENEIEPSELQLMHCEKRIGICEVNIDELNEEYMTEDGEGVSHYHPEIAKKVEELNELIRKAEPKLWFETNKRIIIHAQEQNIN